MKFQGCVSLWDRQNWFRICKPRNIFSLSMEGRPDCTHIFLTILGFHMFFESACALKERGKR